MKSINLSAIGYHKTFASIVIDQGRIDEFRKEVGNKTYRLYVDTVKKHVEKFCGKRRVPLTWEEIKYIAKAIESWEQYAEAKKKAEEETSLIESLTPIQNGGVPDFDKEKRDLYWEIAWLRTKCERQDAILCVLKKHTKKIAEVPGQEKEPDIQITVMPEADEEYETIKKWLEEKE